MHNIKEQIEAVQDSIKECKIDAVRLARDAEHERGEGRYTDASMKDVAVKTLCTRIERLNSAIETLQKVEQLGSILSDFADITKTQP